MCDDGTDAGASDRIGVALVDDHPLFRAGVSQRLSEHEPGLKVLGEAADSRQAQEMVARLAPDVVLMDIAMRGENGIQATRAIKRSAPATAVIILSLYDDEQYIQAAVAAGAAGYLLKTVQGAELAAAVRRAYGGDWVLSPELTTRVLHRVLHQPRGRGEQVRWQHLSERETQVLALAARGAANKGIARCMRLSVRTVEAHMRNIFTKLEVGSRTEAVILAVKAGVLSLDEVGRSDDLHD
jgi:DNA-binding NarL/FixJ family response regulator